jgi:hypothetical protein
MGRIAACNDVHVAVFVLYPYASYLLSPLLAVLMIEPYTAVSISSSAQSAISSGKWRITVDGIDLKRMYLHIRSGIALTRHVPPIIQRM